MAKVPVTLADGSVVLVDEFAPERAALLEDAAARTAQGDRLRSLGKLPHKVQLETGRVVDLRDPKLKIEAASDSARFVASGIRAECLSFRTPPLPLGAGEYLAVAGQWWGRQFTNLFAAPAAAVDQEHDRITGAVQDAIGVTPKRGAFAADRPRKRPVSVTDPAEFVVQVPGWQDIIQIDNAPVFDRRERRERILRMFAQMKQSPAPPSIQDAGKILTTIDNVQDEAATLSVVLMLVEKLVGRALPGVGQVATAADLLNVVNALARPLAAAGFPTRATKRMLTDRAKHSRNGYGGRVEDLRRTGRLKVGYGDVLQGLQATDSFFGAGIQIGAIFGGLIDSFWGVVRGAEFRFPGPPADPLQMYPSTLRTCTRSPRAADVLPGTHQYLGYEALRLWSGAARVLPRIDLFDESALASTLIGMRQAETVLGDWLRSGVWQDLLPRVLDIRPRVLAPGLQDDERGDMADVWLKRTVPLTVGAVGRAIAAVPDPARQAFYESLVSSIGWGLIGDLEPDSRILDQHIMGPWAEPLLDLHRQYPDLIASGLAGA